MSSDASKPPIIQYWHEPEPPRFIEELLASVAERNPDREHLVFDSSAAEDLIGSHFGDRELAAFRSCGLPAMQADYFRYCAVHALGGVYIDADLRCVAPVGPIVADRRGGVLFGRESRTEALVDWLAWPYPVGRFRVVVNGFFGFGGPRHPLLAWAMRLATANVERQLGEGPTGVWLSVGPGIFTALYLLNRLGSVAAFAAFVSHTVLSPVVSTLGEIERDVDIQRISHAFEGVEIRPLEAAGDFVGETYPPSSHRERHWAATAREIYR